MKTEGARFETRKRSYNDFYTESYIDSGDLSGNEFNDIIGFLKAWIGENKLKMSDMRYISIDLRDDEYDYTFDVTFDRRLVESKKIRISGKEPIGLEDHIKTRW